MNLAVAEKQTEAMSKKERGKIMKTLNLTKEDVEIINNLPLDIALGVRARIAKHRADEAKEILSYLNLHIEYLENRDIFPTGY